MTRVLSKVIPIASAMLVLAAGTASAWAADPASPADKAFVAKVSQGGAFEVELGKLAADKGQTQEIKDNGATEAHDHALVNDKLKAISSAAGIDIAPKLNAEFQGKLDAFKSLSGAGFDTAYVSTMEEIHKIDGGLFAKEAKEGSPAFKAFAGETHSIVAMHIGALKATDVKK